MTTYVEVSDLIMNGGEGCTVLQCKPHGDYITIVENKCDCDYHGSITITYNDKCITWRTMRCSDFMVPTDIKYVELGLTVGDLNYARAVLFKNKMCFGCAHFEYYHYFCNNGSDNWDNYKAGSCPNKTKNEMSLGTYRDFITNIS